MTKIHASGIPRRLKAAVAAVFMLGLAAAAGAQTAFPSRPVRLVVPYPAGGPADVLARSFAQRLGDGLGQAVVIDNRGGAGTAIGTKAVADAPADGYTILLGTVSSHALNPIMNPRIGYDPVKDFAAIGPVAQTPFLLVVNPNVPAQSVKELIALAKAKPGTLASGSAGNGTSNHLAIELFKVQTGTDILHVPYKGSAPALADVLSGQVPMMFDLVTTSIPQVKGGTLRALAVTSRERLAALPQVPTMIEAGVADFDVSAWFGVFAPAATPAPVVARLNAELEKALKSTEVRDRLTGLSALPMSATPEQFSAFVRSENQRWTKAVKASGMKIE
jgi:tripartite-type tricarboxylate transporter receptor subunit TctC